MKFKVGDKVILVSSEHPYYEKGYQFTVAKVDDNGVYNTAGSFFYEYRLNKISNDGDSELKEMIIALQSRLEQLGKMCYDEFNKSDNKTFTYEDYKKLVQEAKRFTNRKLGGLWVVNGEFVVIDFNINKDKQTVVALAKTLTFMGKSEVINRGIAKCLPDDIFNEDIGKAIALGRLLGKDVSKFTNI